MEVSGQLHALAALSEGKSHRYIKILWSEDMKVKYYSDNAGVDWRIILKRALKWGCEVVDWIYLAQDTD
jgi:hypothetical protein